MKKILLSVLSLSLFGAASAQTIVSTSVEKKAPVLEEFTGANCTYCPDGHKIAQQLKDANDDVVLVNIHAGSFAPQNPPYRTPFGEAIDDLAAVTGYPAGSVNRDENIFGIQYQGSGSAMSRGSWQSAFAQISSQNSPVNIAIDPSYDESTNELTLLVEVYYTNNTDTNDFLHIAVLQSNVKGPQVGAASFYPEMMYEDGSYNHNHMLRDFITGQWGWDIPTTGENFFWDTTITYTLPATLNGLATNWQDMEIAAYISDTQKDIYTGTSEWFYPKENHWDMSATSDVAVDGFCDDEASVEVEITNNGAATIGSFDLEYSINGGAVQTESYSGSLTTNASTTMSFDVTLEDGLNVISFSRFQNVKDNNDDLLINPTASGFLSKPAGATATVAASGQEAPIEDDFEDVSVGDDPNKFHVVERASGIWPIVVANSYYQNVTENLGGFGESDQSLFFPLGYSTITAGSAYSVISDNYDLSTLEEAELQFVYSYGSLVSNDNSDFTVDVSIDCGETWENIYDEKGEDINNSGVDASYIIFPDEEQWDKVKLDMTDFVGETEVMVRFRIVKDQTNALYIDDVKMKNVQLSVDELSSNEVVLFPNPASDIVTIENAGTNASVELIDVNGRTVLVDRVAQNGVNVSSLAAGVYNVIINSDEGVSNTRLTIVK